MADPKTNGPDGAQLLRRAEEAIDAAGDAVEAAVLHIERPAGERLRGKLADVDRPLRAAPTQQEQPRCGGSGQFLTKFMGADSTREVVKCPGCQDCQPEHVREGHPGFAEKSYPAPTGLPNVETLGAALVNVKHQRFEQERLKAEGRFRFTCADPDLSLGEKLAILTEEVGEVAQQVLEQPDRRLAFDSSGSRAELRKELEQVAAVAVAWVESLLIEASEPVPGGEQ